ncbi:MAG TPA: division/cell wall cluster transcriptional repressor MraZ [Acidimicrobiia bacterium]
MKDFLGEYRHSLDAKGRLILPMDFRSPLADGAVIGIGQHNCLVVYTPEEWTRVAEEIRQLSKAGDAELDAARAFFAGARDVKPDAQGRVPIAADQRDYASLDRDVVVAGVFSRIEIWDAQRWTERKSGGQDVLSAAASLPGFGI